MMRAQDMVICLCGSTKFKPQFEQANRNLTMAGKVVISVGVFGHADAIVLTEDAKRCLDAIHRRKIDMSDAIHVINVGGYIGSSTEDEILYARSQGKHVTYLEQH